MSPEYYYQTTKSGTRFKSVEPDSENTGLDTFHRAQEQAAVTFSEGNDSILVMGGTSGVGKTYAMKKLARASGFDFVDFHSVGQYTRKVDELGATEVARKILEARIVTSTSARLLILDEGVSGVIADGQTKLRHRMDEVIRELLKEYHQLIILGGGARYTSDEQSEIIAESLPKDLDIATQPYPLKNLNSRQTADLAQRANLGIYQDRDISERQLLPREYADLIAELSLPYFRLTRELIRMAAILASDTSNFGNIEPNVKNKIMPDNVFDEAWKIQDQMIERNRARIQDSLRK